MTRYPDGVDPIAFHDLSPSDQHLLGAARQALELAYHHYTKFYVGAAVITNDGNIHTGSNIEISGQSGSMCAERSALAAAHNSRDGDRCVAIGIVARDGESTTTTVTAPCGLCRQVLWQFANRSGVGKGFRVVLATTNFEEVVVTTVGTLLPLAYTFQHNE